MGFKKEDLGGVTPITMNEVTEKRDNNITRRIEKMTLQEMGRKIMQHYYRYGEEMNSEITKIAEEIFDRRNVTIIDNCIVIHIRDGKVVIQECTAINTKE
jgi:hypothetical protein